MSNTKTYGQVAFEAGLETWAAADVVPVTPGPAPVWESLPPWLQAHWERIAMSVLDYARDCEDMRRERVAKYGDQECVACGYPHPSATVALARRALYGSR